MSNTESIATDNGRACALEAADRLKDDIRDKNRLVPVVKNENCVFIPLGPLVTPEKTSNEADWAYQHKFKCPDICLEVHQRKRLRLDLDCKEGHERLIVTETANMSDVYHISYGKPCLHRVINKCCDDGKSIPNVFHYVLYGYKALNIYTLMSLISAVRFQKPCLILIHGPNLPFGRYWDYFLHIYSNVIHVVRDMPTKMGGKELGFKEHGADIARIEAIKDYGGIYFDYDEVAVRSLDPLRNKPCVMGKATDANLSCGVILAQRNATFMQKWYEGYLTDYRPKHWGWNCLFYPTNLAKKFPDLIHISGFNFTTPSWKNLPLLFKQNYNWSKSYAIHLYIRYYKQETTVDSIRSLNTTVGALGRHIFLGNKELCAD
ncbi:hypothetical protein ACJMK2_004617 [Sinanodonta woodiana]|uniref:Alpha-1,4-N-acetylglucosaminyltransferase n=1 Tax=Sinanodonta woodiana TaxID=1069815 RepID=A0ABD3Y291_SINWO